MLEGLQQCVDSLTPTFEVNYILYLLNKLSVVKHNFLVSELKHDLIVQKSDALYLFNILSVSQLFYMFKYIT